MGERLFDEGPRRVEVIRFDAKCALFAAELAKVRPDRPGCDATKPPSEVVVDRVDDVDCTRGTIAKNLEYLQLAGSTTGQVVIDRRRRLFNQPTMSWRDLAERSD